MVEVNYNKIRGNAETIVSASPLHSFFYLFKKEKSLKSASKSFCNLLVKFRNTQNVKVV